MWRTNVGAVLFAFIGAASIGSALAGETEDLARAAQNPVASLISLPFQNNTNFDVGPLEKTQNIMNVNWEANSDDTWTVPFGGGFGKIFKIGNQPLNAQASAYYNVEKPEFGADWQLRLQLQFLFPK